MGRLKPIALLLLLFFAAAAQARTWRSFDLDQCTWNASHIVVATEGALIDGRLTVLESWRGDLRPGETISIPELAAFRDDEARTLDIWRLNPEQAEAGEFGDIALNQVSGDRMILFLTKANTVAAAPWGDRHNVVWQTAGDEGVKHSLIWIEGDRSFAFVQFSSPGSSQLTPLGKTESVIRDRVLQVRNARDSWDRFQNLPISGKRPSALAPYAAMDIYPARVAALKELEMIGSAAVPTLAALLHDAALLDQHWQYLETLTEIGGREAGADLADVVVDASIYWQEALTTLKGKPLRWMGSSENAEVFHQFMRTQYALIGLRELKFGGSVPAVKQLRDILRAAAGQDDDLIRNLSNLCDQLIDEFEPTDRIRAR